MAKCTECDARVTVGALFCAECGAYLLNGEVGQQGAAVESTTRFPRSEPAPFEDDSEMTPPPALVGQEMSSTLDAKNITFVIPTSGRRHTLSIKDEIRIGRADPERGYFPELDLTRDEGAQYGVSRRHALIQQSSRGILLLDLNSTNGTSLNNFRIPPDLPYPLHNGDEVRFGQLLVHVFLS